MATVSVSGSDVTVTGVGAGSATIFVDAEDEAGTVTRRTFTATVE